MINCSHPDHFKHIFNNDAPCHGDNRNKDKYISRIKAIKPNASKKSHKELNDSSTLDDGDPEELGRMVADIRRKSYNEVNVISGCCGTDVRHLRKMVEHVLKG